MERQGMTIKVKVKDKLAKDFVKMLERGSQNDITIKLEDGEIKANKDVFRARCPYFDAMFSNDKFVESKTNVIEMKHVKKDVMEKVISYLFTGQLDVDIGIPDQQTDIIRMFDLFRLLLLPEPLETFTAKLTKQIDLISNLYFSNGFRNEDYVPLYEFSLKTLQLCIDLKFEELVQHQLQLISLSHLYLRECLKVGHRENLGHLEFVTLKYVMDKADLS